LTAVDSTGILSSSVGLVGPGRAGRAFARSWKNAGGRLAWVLARDPEKGAGIGADTVVSPEAGPLPPCDIAVLAVPDDAVTPVAESLAGRLTCRYAFHLAGALGSDAIRSLRHSGSAVGSLHPVRPFAGADTDDWRGAFVAVEGDEPAAEAGERLATAVGARPHRLTATDRSLYHASATLAAGGTAAVVSIGVRGWVAAGIPEDIARETLAALASRAAAAVAERPFAAAFTGAVARRDAGTVRSHVAALGSHAEALAVYRALAEEILRRTPGSGREEEIRQILHSEKLGP
jgi:predicted short-subunit dehydrogenase-like oxidoreductase (DUF2520 family)